MELAKPLISSTGAESTPSTDKRVGAWCLHNGCQLTWFKPLTAARLGANNLNEMWKRVS